MGSGRYRRCDGAVLSAADLAEAVPLHVGELDNLAQLITLIEDWLRFADDDVHDALAHFACAGGGRRSAADLIDELGHAAVGLDRMAKAMRSGDQPLTPAGHEPTRLT
jgi:hypothetical protein